MIQFILYERRYYRVGKVYTYPSGSAEIDPGEFTGF